MEKAKDELRVMAGWAPDSVMPAKYARRYIQKKANIANIRRISSSMKYKLEELEEVIG